MRILVTIFVIALSLLIAPSHASAQTVFASNYDLVLTVGDTQYRATNRVQVEDGHVIPVKFHRIRVDLEVSSVGSDKFQVLITILEQIDGEWFQTDVGPEGFGGRIGAPLQFSWNGDNMRLNVAINVSRSR